MKTPFLILLLIACSISSFAQFKVGGGLSLGTNSSIGSDISSAINIRGDYSFKERWAIAPGFTYVIPSSFDNIKYKSWQMNADLHYKIIKKEKYSVYTLTGINYINEKTTRETVTEFYPSGGFSGTSDQIGTGNVGFNIGAGINYKKLFAELKYDSSYKQFALTVGYRF